jgi:hypothetical protein
VEGSGFGPGTNIKRGLNQHNFSRGSVFDPRLDVPMGRAVFPAGLGATKQGLNGVAGGSMPPPPMFEHPCNIY